MGAFGKFTSDRRGTTPAKQMDSWEGEDMANPLAKGPGFGRPIPSDEEFDRRFPRELAKPNAK